VFGTLPARVLQKKLIFWQLWAVYCEFYVLYFLASPFCRAVACEWGILCILFMYIECDSKVGGTSQGWSEWHHHRLQAEIQETWQTGRTARWHCDYSWWQAPVHIDGTGTTICVPGSSVGSQCERFRSTYRVVYGGDIREWLGWESGSWHAKCTER